MDNPLGGIKRGWEEIKSIYERIFNGPARVYVEFYDYTIHQTNEIFTPLGGSAELYKLEKKKFHFQSVRAAFLSG